MRANVTAPEITLTVEKLAASMSSCPNASRHSNELAANATMATAVSSAVRVAILAGILDRMRSLKKEYRHAQAASSAW